MIDDKTPKKRGRPSLVPLAAGAEMVDAPKAFTALNPTDAAPATFTMPEHGPAIALPITEAAAPFEVPAEPAAREVPDPAPVATPESSVTERVTMKPAPVEAVAIPPVPEPAPASIDATEPAPAEPPSRGTTDMATAFPTAAPLATETADKAKAMFGDMNTRAKSAMEKSVKMGEEMTELTKGNVEALVQSGRIAAKGAETLAQDAAETMKARFESTTATMKSLASVKSPTELFQLQSEAAKSYFDSAVADMSKFTEQMMKLAGDVAQPLSSRYAVAMDKIKVGAL